jgi:ATP-binding protein involved in chromosome partitioning
MRRIPTYFEVEDPAGAEVVEQVVAQQERLAQRLAGVKRVVAVASGKGGVGKSAITANLAAALAVRGQRVGALDADLNGPSLVRMLGATGERLRDGDDGVRPASARHGVGVMSMELLQGEDDVPLRWRGPGGHDFLWQSSLETGALREFLSDVAWGPLDWLLVDVPPGTDKISRLLGLVPRIAGVLLVTTPSEMARFVVAKSARLLRDAGVARIGLVANMTGVVCAGCGARTPLFPGDAMARLVEETGLVPWADVPFDPELAERTDRGDPFVLARPAAPAAVALRALAERLVEELP